MENYFRSFINYLIYTRDLGDNARNFIEAFERFRGPVNRQDIDTLFDKDKKFSYVVPDLRTYEKEFILSNQSLYGLSSLKIHT